MTNKTFDQIEFVLEIFLLIIFIKTWKFLYGLRTIGMILQVWYKDIYKGEILDNWWFYWKVCSSATLCTEYLVARYLYWYFYFKYKSKNSSNYTLNFFFTLNLDQAVTTRVPQLQVKPESIRYAQIIIHIRSNLMLHHIISKTLFIKVIYLSNFAYCTKFALPWPSDIQKPLK